MLGGIFGAQGRRRASASSFAPKTDKFGTTECIEYWSLSTRPTGSGGSFAWVGQLNGLVLANTSGTMVGSSSGAYASSATSIAAVAMPDPSLLDRLANWSIALYGDPYTSGAAARMAVGGDDNASSGIAQVAGIDIYYDSGLKSRAAYEADSQLCQTTASWTPNINSWFVTHTSARAVSLYQDTTLIGSGTGTAAAQTASFLKILAAPTINGGLIKSFALYAKVLSAGERSTMVASSEW